MRAGVHLPAAAWPLVGGGGLREDRPVSSSVQVVAHRGSSGDHAEHTLHAFERAIEEGADALECDVRLTRDGVLVCVHDRRVDRTSNGSGVVSALELADLAELDFASWKAAHGGDGQPTRSWSSAPPPIDAGGEHELHGQAWEEVDSDGGRVLTLDRLLGLVLDARRPVQLHVETKHPTRYGGLVERSLVEVLERHGIARPASRSASRVAILSFAVTSLRRVHALAPSLPTQLNMERVPVRLRDGSLPRQVSTAGLALHILKAHPGYVARLQRHGHRVHVFTVDEPEDVAFLLDLGVDGIISNHPRRVLEQLHRT